MLVVDEESLKILAVNESAIHLYGWSEQEFIGLRIVDLCLDADRVPVQTLLQPNSLSICSLRQFRKDGSILELEVTASPLPYYNRPSWLCVLREVSERTQLLKDLRESHQQQRAKAEELSAVLDAVPAAVWIAHDKQAHRITGNREACDWTHLSAGANSSQSGPLEERPDTFRIFQDGKEMASDDMPVQRASRGVYVRDCQIDLVYPDGSARHLLGNAIPLLNEAGLPFGSVSAFIDVTQQKKIEAAFHAKSAKLQSFYDSAPFYMGIIEFTAQNAYLISGNRALADSLSMEVALLAGKSAAELGIPSSLERVWVKKCKLSEAKMQPVQFEYQFNSRWMHATVAFIQGASNARARFSFIVEDVTLQRKNRQKLLQTKAELELRVEQRTAQLRNLTIALAQAEENERRRVAKVLHDDLQQLLVAAQIHISISRRQVSQETAESLDRALGVVKNAMQVARDLSHDLSLVVLHERGLLEAFKWLASWATENFGIDTRFVAGEITEPSDPTSPQPCSKPFVNSL